MVAPKMLAKKYASLKVNKRRKMDGQKRKRGRTARGKKERKARKRRQREG